MNLSGIGKVLLMVGGVLLLTGWVFMAKDKISWMGRFSGDTHIKRETFSPYFSLTTPIISILMLLLFALFRK